MRILVTGATGFIGSNLVHALEAQGHEVVAIGAMHERKLDGFKGKLLYKGILGVDLSSIGRIDALLHQGAISDTRVYDREEVMRANLETPKALFEYAISNGCKHIAYASSTAVYGNVPPPYKEDGPTQPLNPYAESKLLLDEYAMQFAKEHPGVSVVGLRYCNVYGPGEAYKGKTSTMIYQFAQQMQKGNPKLFTPGDQKRDYIYVKDVVAANVQALSATKSGVYNCGSGVATSFNDIVSVLNKTLGLSREPEYFENPYGDEYQSYTLCDMSHTKEHLEFVPEYTIEKGIEDYAKSGFLIYP